MSVSESSHAPTRDEQAAYWCITLAEGELEAAERAEFGVWIDDLANARALDEATAVWNATAELGETPELIGHRAAALESLQRVNGRRWARPISGGWRWAAGMAAMLAVVLLGTLFLRTATTEYRTGIGERRVAILADGSRLSLDADSVVRVRLLKERRELTLVRGRAKFDVAKDPLRPFAVTVGPRMVVATGTSFSVEMRREQMRVVLYEGRVAVLDTAGERPRPDHKRVNALAQGSAEMILTPGRELVAPLRRIGDARVTSADPVRSLAWESGQLSFDDEPLASAVAQVNRYARERIVIGDPRLADVRISGFFTAGDTGAFLDALAELSPARARRQGSEIVLRHE
ncbi:FecR domain-containing protein [Sphingomonas sp. IC-56]|uniref:FecR family protein n=1 Tax=Sphingomonas sp. IC-56 TaxID=2898529 RepID=UPI001E64D1B1|nr:FecR domain-containing protein [Sphingomonas sp. IC-56]MCD2324412.1 FecR domain-containing protein [Sphingomonas sp. IC-56]